MQQRYLKTFLEKKVHNIAGTVSFERGLQGPRRAISGSTDMKTGIGSQLDLFEHIVTFTKGRQIIAGAIDHGLEQTVFLGLADGLGMHNDLVLVINGRNAIVALDDSVAGLHLGAFIVGDVAFYRLARFTYLIII